MKTRMMIAGIVAVAAACAWLVPATATGTAAVGTIGTLKAEPLIVRGFVLKDSTQAAGVPDDIKTKGGKGPNQNKYVDLFTQFSIPNSDRILSLSDRIYFDLEEESGIYYYGPKDYSLAHDPDYGHLFRIRYGIVSTDAESPSTNVAVAFTLWGGWSRQDYDLLKVLLNKYLEREKLPACADLKALPFHSCGFTFGAASSYGVPDNQISVPALSDIAGYMDVTLTTDEQTVEGLKVGLQDIQGLTGKVQLVTAQTEGEGFAIPEITAHVSLCDTRTYQREPYVRNQSFTNRHDFPVRLKTLYFLMDAGDDVKLFEYDLGNTLVLPGKQASLNHARVNTGLANNAVRAWYEYRLANEGDTIQEYWDAVMKRLTVGLGKRTVKMLTVEVLDEDMFADYTIELIKVQVRSKHFDPNSKTELTKNYKLTADEAAVTGDALFFIEGEETEGISYFEYKITMINLNGDVKRDTEWRQGIEDDEGIYIGKKHFDELIGPLDGDDDAGDDDAGDDE
ncbi:MAG: hypothetical protein JW889_10415 [Verrucomicrobia bacterium]|nr:hypothetical protein [Verrucomicrobiota bacterium]